LKKQQQQKKKSKEEISDEPQKGGSGNTESQGSRAEKKVKKSMEKLGLKLFKGVSMVFFTIDKIGLRIRNPEVYKYGPDNFVIFGVGEQLDLSQQQAPQQQEIPQYQEFIEKAKKETKKPIVEDEGPVDETGVDSKDIDLVLQQAQGVTRSQAVKALRSNNGDIVNAIMSLTGV